MAIGINKSAVVVLDINELKKADVMAKEKRTPRAVLGNMDNNL